MGERNVVVLVAPAGVGVVMGLGALNVVSRRLGRPHVIGVGLLVTCIALIVLAGARPFADVFAEPRFGGGLGGALPFFIGMVSGTAFVFGGAYSFITCPARTLFHEVLPDVIQGLAFGGHNSPVSIFY